MVSWKARTSSRANCLCAPSLLQRVPSRFCTGTLTLFQSYLASMVSFSRWGSAQVTPYLPSAPEGVLRRHSTQQGGGSSVALIEPLTSATTVLLQRMEDMREFRRVLGERALMGRNQLLPCGDDDGTCPCLGRKRSTVASPIHTIPDRTNYACTKYSLSSQYAVKVACSSLYRRHSVST